MRLASYLTHNCPKRSRLGWWTWALACVVLVQLLGLIHQTQHASQDATANAVHFDAQRGVSVAFEHVAHGHLARQQHIEHRHIDVLGHEQGSVSCQLFDVAAGSLALLSVVVATAACDALFACPLAVCKARPTNTPFALYSARAPPARLT